MALTQISTDGIKNGTITGSDLATNIDLIDDQKIRFGTGNDLELFHSASSSRSFILNNTGHLIISNMDPDEDNEIHLRARQNKQSIVCKNDGGVELYHNNSKKFETTSSGVTISGANATGTAIKGSLSLQNEGGTQNIVHLPATGKLRFADNKKATFGNSDDLQIYHDGTNSRIHNTNAGAIIIRNEVQDADISIEGNDGGSNIAMLHLDASESGNATFTGNIKLTDTKKINLGQSNDLSLTHTFINNSFNGVINNATNALFIESDGITIRDKSGEGGEVYAQMVKNGAVSLRYDNNLKFQTTSTGVTVTGQIISDGLHMGDSEMIKLGSSNDLLIYHNGSDSYVQDDGTGKLVLSTNGARIDLYDNTNAATLARFITGGSVELYEAGNKKFETRSNGIQVTGYTYSDGVTIGNGTSEKYLAGDSNQLQMYHTGGGGNGYINNGTGTLLIGGPVVSFTNQANNAFLIRAVDGGTAELYYNGSKKLETTSEGVLIGNGGLHLGDNNKIEIGNSDDFEIYHNGTNSIVDNNTGALSIQTTSNLELEVQSNFRVLTKGGSENCIQGITDGAVELYHNNSKKFETRGDGAIVTGRLKQTTGCAFRARATSDGQTIQPNTPTKVNFGTQVYDYGDVYNPSNSRFTAPVNGVYNFSWSVRMGTPSSTPKLDAEIRVNGNSNVNYVNCGYNQQASNNAAWIGSGDMYMSAGDYAELFVDQNTSSSTNLTDTSNANNLDPGNHIWWTGHLIHEA